MVQRSALRVKLMRHFEPFKSIVHIGRDVKPATNKSEKTCSFNVRATMNVKPSDIETMVCMENSTLEVETTLPSNIHSNTVNP